MDFTTCIPCSSIDSEKPYRYLSMNYCSVCPLEGSRTPEPVEGDMKCSTNCGYVYRVETNECIKCSAGQQPSDDGLSCEECATGYHSFDGIECIQTYQ